MGVPGSLVVEKSFKKSMVECMARFPTDPQAAAKIYKQAEKKIGPANSRDYDVVFLRREAQELLDGKKPAGPAL